MSKRSYKQACPLARSLDLIGERWTLLIVRDLLLGPLRFSDLLSRLPGIGRNLLATRLRSLEEAAIVAKHRLPPPAASTVYALTDKGVALEGPLLAFSAWGMRFLSEQTPTDEEAGGQDTEHVEPDLLGLGLKMMLQPGCSEALEGEVGLCVDGVDLRLRFSDGGCIVERGMASDPILTLSGAIDVLVAVLLRQAVDPSLAIEEGALEVQGDRSRLKPLLAAFSPSR